MSVRQVDVKLIENAVKELCLKANTILRPDILNAIKESFGSETNGTLVKKMMGVIVENAKIAEEENIPICQDTGMVTVFVEMGQDVVLCGGNVSDAINRGVENAYKAGCFRKSVVGDPILRDNTGANTPAVIHFEIVDGDKVSVSVMPKGFGSENKGRIAMLNPTCGKEDILDFCVEVVKSAGPDACPPYTMGIGIGGTMERSVFLAKKALLRPIDSVNSKAHIADLEQKIKEKANQLGIGVMGLGGVSTVIGVNIEEEPTHIAGLPVAVNLSCHALRSASMEI